MIIAPPSPFITLDELKRHLDKTKANNDVELGLYIQTSCAMIRERMGEVGPATAEETVDTRDSVIVLTHTPVISITSIVTMPDALPVPQANEIALDAGWQLISSAGILRHTAVWPRRVRITYVAGRDPIPANFKLAALELASHLWRSTKLNTEGGRPQLGEDGQVIPGTTFALPMTVRQLLGLDKRPRDEIFIA
jgi:hypothetical protein